VIGISRGYSLRADVEARRPPKSSYGSPGFSSDTTESMWTNPSFGQQLTPDQMFWTYLHNVWVRCCVDKTVKRVVAVEPVVKAFVPFGKKQASAASMRRAEECQKFLDNPNSYFESQSTLRAKVAKDTLIYDAAALEIVRSNNKIYQMVSVSGPTIRFNRDKKTKKIPWDAAYYQEVDGKKVATFKYNEIIYMMLNPRSGYMYGLSPLETLASTVAAELYASNYNLDFFANDATPKFAALFNSVGTSDEGLEMKMARWRDYFDQELRGHPHRPLLMANEQGTVDLRLFSMQQADMQFQEYSQWLLTKIMAVYDMQPFVMGIILPTTGRLNSEQQDEVFKEGAIKPQLRLYAEGVNQYIIWDENGFGYDDVYLDYYGLDLVDDKIQSQIDEVYLKTGVITINDVRDELGKPRVAWGYRPLVSSSTVSLPEEDVQTKAQTSDVKAQKDYEEEINTVMRDAPKGALIPSSGSPMETRMLRQRKLPTGLTPEQEKEGITRIVKRVAGRRKYVLSGMSSTPVK
jgi:HK97 family phage portal protein